jgi:flagellar basal-body rod protein FlgF
MDAGPVMATGRPMDIALADTALLTVQSPNGGLAFTRRGDLKVNIQGQLENGSGHLVLGENGPITIPPGLMVNVNVDGSIFARNPAQEGAAADVLIDRLRLRDSSGVSLARRQDGLFKIAEKPDGTDIEVSGLELRVIPQALESSNVSAIEAMTRLMDQSRSFETQIKIIKETKSLDESGSSMMKPA